MRPSLFQPVFSAVQLSNPATIIMIHYTFSYHFQCALQHNYYLVNSALPRYMMHINNNAR